MARRVCVLGGGVAGLSAAHELVLRGYEVDVYEARRDLGGKARSQMVAGTGAGGREDLPGEHGFRFYPAFYKHLIQTMREIPLDLSKPLEPDDVNGGGNTVYNNLKACGQAGIAPDGSGLLPFLRRQPETSMDIVRTLELFFKTLRVSLADMGRFTYKILRYLSSCKKRREREYEEISWWTYLGGDGYSPQFQRYLRAVPRIMVAMDPQRGSARTIGNISMQLMADYAKAGYDNDRTMVGPTTAAWIAPWRRFLEQRGARFHLGKPVRRLEMDPKSGRIQGARVEGETSPVMADYYVLAVPLEVAVEVVTDEMAGRCEEIAKLKEIREKGLADCSRVEAGGSDKMLDWMVGVQYFLREDVPLIGGHVFYPDSPWALSSISQAQFWEGRGGLFRGRYGDGSAGGVLSVDVSDWNRQGVLFGKPAKHCTAEEIRREVWEQLKRGLNTGEGVRLKDANLLAWNLDHDIEFPEGDPASPRNSAPLLVHPPGSWRLRPEAQTSIENLVLASDYVRTETNLACMEGANEAARRAVNAILREDGHPGPACQLWTLVEDDAFDRAKKLDEIAYTRGRSALMQELVSFGARGPATFGPSEFDENEEIAGFFMNEAEAGAEALDQLTGLQAALTLGETPP